MLKLRVMRQFREQFLLLLTFNWCLTAEAIIWTWEHRIRRVKCWGQAGQNVQWQMVQELPESLFIRKESMKYSCALSAFSVHVFLMKGAQKAPSSTSMKGFLYEGGIFLIVVTLSNALKLLNSCMPENTDWCLYLLYYIDTKIFIYLSLFFSYISVFLNLIMFRELS